VEKVLIHFIKIKKRACAENTCSFFYSLKINPRIIYLAVINLPIKFTMEVIIFKSGILVSFTGVLATIILVCVTVVSAMGVVLTYRKQARLTTKSRIAKTDFEL
jgi:hypothetical protein